MNQTFLISGMTCLSCKANVEDTINSLEEVTKVEIDFKKKELNVNSKKNIDLATFQKLLPSKYTLSIKNPKTTISQYNLKIRIKFNSLNPYF